MSTPDENEAFAAAPFEGSSVGYFSEYRETVARRVAAVEVRTPERGRFSSTIAERRLGQLRLFHIESDAVCITRSARCISADRGDQYLVAINRVGDCVVQHGHAALVVPSNAFYLLDKMLPYETVFSRHSARILVSVPRQHLDDRLTDPGRLLARVASAESGTGRIATEFLVSVFREAPRIDPARQTQVAQICLDLLAMALAEEASAPAGDLMDRRPGRRILMPRIKAYIRAHLTDPSLSPPMISDAVGISKRYLHQLFSESGASVSGWIREERLGRARAALCNPRLSQTSVTEIAYDCGFSDTAHFSRLFKARFGIAPSRLRAAAGEATPG